MSTRVLVQMPHNPGDVIMAMQAIQASWWPAIQAKMIQIDFIVDQECAALAQGSPLFHQVFVQPRQTILQAWSADDLGSAQQQLNQFIELLQSTEYDLSVNLYQGLSGALIQKLVHAQLKRGPIFSQDGIQIVQDKWSRYLHSVPANRQANPYHAVDIYRRILRPALFEQQQLPSEAPQALELPPFKEFSWPRDYLCIQVGSAWPGKKWPTHYWRKFIQLFGSHPQVQAGQLDLLFIGAPSEKSEVEDLTQGHPHCHNLCGSTNLIDLAGILQSAQMLFCPDTFAMHLGAALGIQTLSIFGPSHPVETSAWWPQVYTYFSTQNRPSFLDFENSKDLEKIHPDNVYQVMVPFLQHGMAKVNLNINSDISQLSKSSWSSEESRLLQSHSPQVSLEPRWPDAHQVKTMTQDLLIEQSQALQYALTHQDWSSAMQDIETRELEITQSCPHNMTIEQYRIELNCLSLKMGVQHYFSQRKKLIQKYLEIIETKKEA